MVTKKYSARNTYIYIKTQKTRLPAVRIPKDGRGSSRETSDSKTYCNHTMARLSKVPSLGGCFYQPKIRQVCALA